MMKRFFVYLFLLILPCAVAYADDFFDNYAGVDNAWDGQRAITNKEFEEAINVLEGDKKKKEEKKRKKKVKKISGGGTSLHNVLDPKSEILSQDEIKPDDKNQGQLLNIPLSLYIGNKSIESGYYNVYGERDKNDRNVYLSFYQAHDFIGKVPAYVTEDDYNSDSINFVKLIPYNENFVKIIYGSLDFNAYAFVQISN